MSIYNKAGSPSSNPLEERFFGVGTGVGPKPFISFNFY
jgi:hypothetical protein